MKKKNEKGFALILALVLLLVMSLMGGALIVISAGDHKSNNSSDTYQQTFYVAETALFEGEKYVINQFLGPWVGDARNASGRNLPVDIDDATSGMDRTTDCYNSFPDIENKNDLINTQYVVYQAGNFGLIFKDFFNKRKNTVFLAGGKDDMNSVIDKEKDYLERFTYEFFIDKIGTAPFYGTGVSIKKGSMDSASMGMAYRIYGCGSYTGTPKTIVPLESLIVLPSS